jgi:hypothetical protein
MARLTILTVEELHTLYGLPQFTDEERDIIYILRLILRKSIRTRIAKTGNHWRVITTKALLYLFAGTVENIQ